MNGLFSYDSKLMQMLGFIADLFICNILYLICCIPVFTIGAAQAGLHSAMRTLGDTQDDRSAVKQFFKGFASGFGKITLSWLLVFVCVAILVYTSLVCFQNKDLGIFLPWGIPFAALCICAVYHSMLPAFHSQFGCTFGQLLRNSLITMLMHPIRSVALGALLWLPLFLFIMVPQTFIQLSPLFLTVYFSTCCLLGSLLLRKPFKMLIDHYTGEDLIEEERREKERAEDAEIEAEAKANLARRKADEKDEVNAE